MDLEGLQIVVADVRPNKGLHNRIIMTVNTARQIAHVLGISLSELFRRLN